MIKNFYNFNIKISLILVLKIIFSLFISSALGGFLRSLTVKLKKDENFYYRQGTILSIIIWILGLLFHVLEEVFEFIPKVNLLLLSIGLSLFIEHLTIHLRILSLEKNNLIS